MSFDTALRSHIIDNPELNALVGNSVHQALIVDESTDKATYFPAIVFELEEERRDVKTDRVKANYWICYASEELVEAQQIEQLTYKQFKDFNGQLNGEFPCSMEFQELKRKYNGDLKYWIVYSKYAVSYKYEI